MSVWFDEGEIGWGESWPERLEAGLRNSDVLVPLVDPSSNWRPNLFFELGFGPRHRQRVVLIVPKDLDPSVLPLNVRLRLFLIRDTPEHTAEELSSILQAA